jgi:dihydrofolate reductase
VFIASSLDGFIADAAGGVDFLERVAREGEDYGFADFWRTIDALVIGRKTYETALGFAEWPYGERRCIVLTSGAATAVPTHNEEFVSGDVRELVSRLDVEGVSRVYVDGGVTIGSFLDSGLIDDITLSIVPVVLGAGTPLFVGRRPELVLRLAGCTPFPSGLVQLVYTVE